MKRRRARSNKNQALAWYVTSQVALALREHPNLHPELIADCAGGAVIKWLDSKHAYIYVHKRRQTA